MRPAGPDAGGPWDKIATATVDLVGRNGYDATTVEEIVSSAGVEREQFDALFADKEDCFFQVWDWHGSEFVRHVTEAFESQRRWPDQIRAAAWAALARIEEDVVRTRFLSLTPFVVSDAVQARLEQYVSQLVDLVDAGRQELEDPASVDRAAAEGVVGAIVGIVLDRLRRDRVRQGADLVPQLVYMATLPYVGEEAAQQELRRTRG